MLRVLSPRQLAAAIGVSESSLKRWTDEGLIKASRTAGGHRRIALAEAIRFVRETQARIVDPTVLGLADLDPEAESPPRSDRIDTFYSCLVEGRGRRVRSMLLTLYLEGVPVTELADDMMQPAMARLGELWREQSDGIFIEHRATDLCIQGMNLLQSLIELPEDAPAAVGGAPSGDPYILGSLTASTCLRDAGVRAMNLGPDTPLTSLVHAVDHCAARLVWLSIGNMAPPRELAAQIQELAEKLESRSVGLVIGGREVAHLGLDTKIKLHVGGDMRELVAYARGLLHPSRHEVSTSNGTGAASSANGSNGTNGTNGTQGQNGSSGH